MDNQVHVSYLIPSSRVEGLTKMITKLARKIAKGKTDATFAPTIEVIKEVIMVGDNGYTRKYNPTTTYSRNAVFASYTWVTIQYERPIVDGWELVAVYDWEITDEGKHTCYISTVPGQMVPNEYREIEPSECNHCNTKRRRNKSMLITQYFRDFKIVGSTCIKDFLGHMSPERLLDLYSFESSLGEMTREYSTGGATIAMIPVRDILEVAAMYVRTCGYIKSRDYDRGVPTVDCVNSYLFPYSDEEKIIASNTEPSVNDIITAENTVKWVLEQDTASEFMLNLHRCIEAGAVSHKRMAIVASAISVYNRAMDKLVVDNTPKDNEHMGAVGDRLRGLIATVKRVRYTEGQFGTTSIITLMTGNGNTLVWFASKYIEVEKHDAWRLDGTVKKHDEFNGTRQTVLTRVKYKSMSQEKAA